MDGTGPGAEQKQDRFALPPPAVLRELAAKQDERARQIKADRAKRRKAASQLEGDDGGNKEQAAEDERRDTAAQLIQRNYRGYRARRELEGHGLDPSTRWMEAVKEAKWDYITTPRSRRQQQTGSPVRTRWKRVTAVAHRVGSDDTSESDGEVEGLSAEQREMREARKQEKKTRDEFAKGMGLEYWLEAVDQKHRYGSNLRRYHGEWKRSDTDENFFYWLDHGNGKDLDLEDRPRERLDREQVRYLSREERQKYLVKIDGQGRFRFAKNDLLITTSYEFRDSVDGIVPIDDKTPTWREVTTGQKAVEDPGSSSDDGSSTSLSSIGRGSAMDESKYANTEFHDAKGLAKLQHISVNSLMNHLLRKTTRKNTWIFVADTSFRLYVGIKDSGAFQHSSFLHGARVSAAGLIKIKRGALRKLSPLSGHYAPPLHNFKLFVTSLKAAGADMQQVSISRSYAVLLGLEGYLGAKKKVKGVERGFKDMINPEERRRREEEDRDKSQSAEKERRVLAKLERERRKNSKRHSMMRKLGLEVDERQDLGDDEGEGQKKTVIAKGEEQVVTSPSEMDGDRTLALR